MKLLFLLLALLSIASPAEARHHRHAHQHHAMVPLPQPRPVTAPGWAIPQQTVAERLVVAGMWRLQTDAFLRGAGR